MNENYAEISEEQFKQHMLRGRGACYYAVRENPKKYLNCLLWACGNEVSFDTQSCGNHSDYIYGLICLYEDKTPFLDALIENFGDTNPDGGWKMQYLAELLNCFYRDGSERAGEALWQKYENLLQKLAKTERLPDGIFAERDDFELLCVTLAEGGKAVRKIVKDIGWLFGQSELYDGYDFDWLYADKIEKYMPKIKIAAENDGDLARFIKKMREYQADLRKERENYRSSARKTSGQDGEARVRKYLESKDCEERAAALRAFFGTGYPHDPQPVIDDANSENLDLREVARCVLEETKHPKVRKFALDNLDSPSAVCMLIKNYAPDDEETLVRLVKNFVVDFEETSGWHGVQSSVLDMDSEGHKVPKELLYYIYESTYCPSCRNLALEQLAKRRLITKEIATECLHDCDEDTVKLASSWLKRSGADE